MPLDESDKKFITDLLGEHAKQFVTAEAAAKMVEQGVKSGLEGLKLDEKLKAIGEKKGDQEEEKKESKAGDKKGEDGQVNARIEDLNRRLKEAEEKREQAEQAAREQKLTSSVAAALDKAGVPAARHQHALAYLRTLTTEDGKPVLRVTEDGKAVWAAQRKGYVDSLDIEAGAKEWAGSDDGKAFLPATNAQGTGEGKSQPVTPRNDKGAVEWGSLKGRLADGLANADIIDL